jgi:uncharacterized protein (TIGR02678 family)
MPAGEADPAGDGATFLDDDIYGSAPDSLPDAGSATGVADTEVGQVIAALLRRPLLTAEHNPDVFRLAVLHRDELVAWFSSTTGWRVEIQAADGLCRLYKRRADPPADRAPQLLRQHRAARRPAPPLVLVLLCLVCEQLWRHPETSFNDLQRALVQSCAAEADSGRLPRFQPVAPTGREHARASADRVALVDAIRVLADWRVIVVDRPLEVIEQDDRADLVVTARRERLAALLAGPSPTLLDVDLDQPATHVPLLCADQAELPEHASASQRDLRRRHTALRAVLDDPGVTPDTDGEAGGYLASVTGRRQALDTAAAAGLVCTVRRDWWVVADPAGTTTDLDFPHSRAHEQHAALLLLAELRHRDDPAAPVTLEVATALLRAHLDRRPWWAARYRGPSGARRLAARAACQLVEVGVLQPASAEESAGTEMGAVAWVPTPAIHLWQVRVADAIGTPGPTAGEAGNSSGDTGDADTYSTEAGGADG